MATEVDARMKQLGRKCHSKHTHTHTHTHTHPSSTTTIKGQLIHFSTFSIPHIHRIFWTPSTLHWMHTHKHTNMHALQPTNTHQHTHTHLGQPRPWYAIEGGRRWWPFTLVYRGVGPSSAESCCLTRVVSSPFWSCCAVLCHFLWQPRLGPKGTGWKVKWDVKGCWIKEVRVRGWIEVKQVVHIVVINRCWLYSSMI